MKSKLTFVFLFCCSAFMQLHAQSLLPDSAQKKLSAAEFIEIVKAYHPVAKQANLLTERAQAELLIARGGWDPLIKSEYDRKTYDGANYY